MDEKKSSEHITENEEPFNNSEIKQTDSKNFLKKYNKRLLIFSVLLVVIVVIVFVASKKQEQPIVGKLPPQEPENVLLATLGDKKIYRNDAKVVALEQYLASGLTSKILRLSLDIAVERVILDSEATSKKIVVDKGKNKIEYYENLKNTIIARELGTVTANSISFWVPAFHDIYPQKAEYQQMRDLQPKVFSEAISELQKGKSTYEIGKSIIANYPVFTSQLAVNSYILSKVSDISLMKKPVVYQYLVNSSNKLLMDFIFSMNKDQIKTLIWPDGEGAAIVQVVDKNVGAKATYDEWLKNKEKTIKFEQENVSKL